MLTLGLRRLREHPTALLALFATALMCLLVLGSLQLFARAVTAGAAGTTIAEAGPNATVIGLSGGTGADRWEAQRALVRRAAAVIPGAVVREVIEPTSMGIAGREESDRAALSAIADLPRLSRLTAGAWPAPTAVDPVAVALPDTAARALGVAVGDTLRLRDLLRPDEPDTAVVVTGTFAPTNPRDPVWAAAPLALTGIASSDFTSYGPFAISDAQLAALRMSGSGRWTISIPTSGLDAGAAAARRAQVQQAMSLLQEGSRPLGLIANTQAGAAFAAAETEAKRTQLALLTPAILVALLGGVALAMSAAQLAQLRAIETALIRARGASTAHVGTVALVDVAVIVLPAALVAAMLAPLVSSVLIERTGLARPTRSYAQSLVDRDLLIAMGLALILAVGIVVVTATRAGQLRTTTQRSRSGALVARYAGAGVDVVLILIGLLGLWQLRRYDASTPRVDPLTLAAPALVLGGLSVLGLRILPPLAALAGRAAARRTGLALPWGAWQVARRLRSQSGPVLLVFLAIAMGAMALAQNATLERMLVDQSRVLAGAPVTAYLRPDRLGSTAMIAPLEGAAGGPDRLTQLTTVSGRLGTSSDMTAVLIDAAAAPDVLVPLRAGILGEGTTWASALGALAVPARGLEIPAGTREIAARVQLSQFPYLDRAVVEVVIDYPNGQREVIDAGVISAAQQAVRARLPEHLPAGGRLIALRVDLDIPWTITLAQTATLDARVTRLRFDDTSVPAEGSDVNTLGGRLFLFGEGAASAAPPVPALITEDLARELKAAQGDILPVAVPQGTPRIAIARIVEVIPGADNPRRAVLIDHHAFSWALDRQESQVASVGQPWTTRYWLAPRGEGSVQRIAQVDGVERVETYAGLLADRREGPANAGMRSALTLLTASALALAILGFAAATAALAAARRREAAILTALGAAPGTIRKAVIGERVVVLVLAAAIGTLIGVACARVVVPLLVAGGGVRGLLSVVTDFALPQVASLALIVVGVLSLVAAGVVLRTGRDVGGQLRVGDRE